MGGSSSVSTIASQGTTRFAAYIEDAHNSMLNVTHSYITEVKNNSPYSTYTDIEIADAFLGVGLIFSGFPDLYSMYGKFMAGFSLEQAWESTAKAFFDQDATNTASQESDLLSDQTVSEYAKLSLAMRELNAVHTSSYVLMLTNLENTFIAKLEAYSAEEKQTVLRLLHSDYVARLNWNKATIMSYAVILKYCSSCMNDGTELNYRRAADNLLWPFMTLDFEKAALGAMQRSTSFTKVIQPKTRSDISKVLLVSSTTVNGAFLGSMVGGGTGTVVGATVGFIVGVAQMLLE